MISIYLFTKKSQFIFLMSFVFNFQKSYLHLLYQKNLLQNFNLGIKICRPPIRWRFLVVFLLFYSSDHPEIKLHGAARWDG